MVTGCKDKGLEKKLTFDQNTCYSSGFMVLEICADMYMLLQDSQISP